MITIMITTVYSSDLGHKETMMMDSMMKLPDDMFRQEILQFLTVYDIKKLDNACMNHKYRLQLLDKISGVILAGDKDESMKASLFKWLGMRRIYFIKIVIADPDFYFKVSVENNYIDQFRYTQHVNMKGPIRDDMAMLIISHCPCLLSIEISSVVVYLSLSPQVTDYTLQLIAEHCTGFNHYLSMIVEA